MSEKIPLEVEEIEQFTATNADWDYSEDKLMASFTLRTFEDAIKAINEIAEVCTKMDHHPLMTNVYNKLMFSIATHSAGDKVTELDLSLATKISEIVKES